MISQKNIFTVLPTLFVGISVLKLIAILTVPKTMWVCNWFCWISIFGNELTKIGNTDNAMYSYGFNMKYAKSCSMKVQNFPQYIFVFPEILWKKGKKTCEIKNSRGCNNHRKPMWNYCVLGVITIYEIISCEMRYGIRQPMA